jgi:TIR domain
MAQVFLNHKTEEKTIALVIKKYLSNRLISSWLDSEEIKVGSKLNASILEGIRTSRYFIALISHRYVRSDWCMHELEQAQRHALKGNVIIIPVLLNSQKELKCEELSVERVNTIDSLLQTYKYIQYDQYDPDKSGVEIADTIGFHNKISFNPIKKKTIQGITLQLIEFKITSTDDQNKPHLPTNFLETWDMNEKDLIDFQDYGTEDKPLHIKEPVAFNGGGPAWLYAYFAVKFKNWCPFYVYNSVYKEYVCVYGAGNSPSKQGHVLKEG